MAKKKMYFVPDSEVVRWVQIIIGVVTLLWGIVYALPNYDTVATTDIPVSGYTLRSTEGTVLFFSAMSFSAGIIAIWGAVKRTHRWAHYSMYPAFVVHFVILVGVWINSDPKLSLPVILYPAIPAICALLAVRAGRVNSE